MFEINLGILSTILGAIGSIVLILGSLIRLGASINKRFNEATINLATKLDGHEEKDQRRHEENIERFAKIETKLNIIMKNGH